MIDAVVQFFVGRPIYILPLVLFVVFAVLDIAGTWEERKARRRSERR